MASRKVYFTEPACEAELEAYKNVDGELFISLADKSDGGMGEYIALPPEDAKELITELAIEFGILPMPAKEIS